MTGNQFDPPDFLSQPPAAVAAQDQVEHGTGQLRDATIAGLMAIAGVDGVWMESAADGTPEVVAYVTERAAVGRLPARVEGLPTRVQTGTKIVALPK